MLPEYLSLLSGGPKDDFTSWMSDSIDSATDCDDFMRDVAAVMDDDFDLD